MCAGLVVSLFAVGVSESISHLVRLRNHMLSHILKSNLSPRLCAATALIALSTLSVVLTCAAAAMVWHHILLHQCC